MEMTLAKSLHKIKQFFPSRKAYYVKRQDFLFKLCCLWPRYGAGTGNVTCQKSERNGTKGETVTEKIATVPQHCLRVVEKTSLNILFHFYMYTLYNTTVRMECTRY
jgi:hypothetical protein